MEKWGILHSTEAYNLILQAVIRIPVVGAHYTTYNNMIAHQVEPNLHTFHILLDGTLAEGSVKNTKKAAYYLWRSLMKEWPRVQPDVELINKFIHCCLVCSDHERGLVFLSALSDCSVHPNLHTFSLLFKVSLCSVNIMQWNQTLPASNSLHNLFYDISLHVRVSPRMQASWNPTQGSQFFIEK